MIITQKINVQLICPLIMRSFPLVMCSIVRFFHLLFFITFIALPVFSTYAQGSLDEAIVKIENISSTSPREKIYIHFDRSNYLAGEDIWYQLYLVDANTNRHEGLNEITYVELIDPENKILSSKTFKVNNGCVEGDFKLDEHLIEGLYTIRAYTNYMRNFDNAYFFKKTIHVNSLKPNKSQKAEPLYEKQKTELGSDTESSLKPDVQFFPEGGYLVDGFINQIGFKALGTNGKGIDISGIIVDDTGERVARLKSSKFGLGAFNFIPKPGSNYQAIVNYNGLNVSYELPKSLRRGVVMHVGSYKDHFRIDIQSSLEGGTKDLEIIGRKNGEIISRAIITKGEAKAVITVPKSSLKLGILQFTVMDGLGTPICERLVFVGDGGKEPKVIISSSKKKFQKRELVELDITLDNAKRKVSEANISVAITDVATVPRDSLGWDIKSYLLLNSELKGEIEQPGYYFISKDTQREKNLDLLMMTQGWRQFIWNEVKKDSLKKLEYPRENGFSFTGIIKDYFDRSRTTSLQVSLMIRNKETFEMNETVTGEQGHFEFRDYDLNDSTLVIIQAKKTNAKKSVSKKSLKNQKMNYFIELDSFESPKINMERILSNENFTNQIMEESQADDRRDSSFEMTEDQIELEEVELISHVSVDKYDDYVKNKQLYRNPSQRVDFKDLGKNIYGDLIQNLNGRVAGFTTMYIEGEWIGYFLRNAGVAGRPLYLLDGMPVSMEAIKTIPMVEILFVDVLLGTKATIYGSAGSNGVIAVYTKDGSENEGASHRERKGIIDFIHPGYSPIRKFYTPKYSSVEKEQYDRDNRKTIYWKPMITLDEHGRAKISFYSADKSTTYRVLLEGITADGEPILDETYISIE